MLNKYEQKVKDDEVAKKMSDEESEKLKNACRRLFTTDDGKIVARAMMRLSGIYKLSHNAVNPIEMGAERGKEYMYLFFVKGMLKPEQVVEIERAEPKQGGTDV